MPTRRILAVAALLAAAGLTLSACGPDEARRSAATGTATPSPSGSASASAPVSAAASGPSTAAAPSSAPALVPPSSTTPPPPRPSSAPPTSGRPTGVEPVPASGCTAEAQRPGHKVIQAVSARNASYEIAIAARDTRIVCHDGRPWESSYVATGTRATYPTLTETAVQLVTATGKMDEYKDVTVEKLAAHINSCAEHRAVAPPFKCYGNLYDITLDSAGQIITVEELHP